MAKSTDQQLQNKRRFTRVVFSRTAKLIFADRTYDDGRVHDLSIGGLFLEGRYNAGEGEHCEIELVEKGLHSSLTLKFQAKVVRVENKGIALKFLDMPQDSYKFLQTMVLYFTDDPFGVSFEFLEDFPSEEEDIA